MQRRPTKWLILRTGQPQKEKKTPCESILIMLSAHSIPLLYSHTKFTLLIKKKPTQLFFQFNFETFAGFVVRVFCSCHSLFDRASPYLSPDLLIFDKISNNKLASAQTTWLSD